MPYYSESSGASVCSQILPTRFFRFQKRKLAPPFITGRQTTAVPVLPAPLTKIILQKEEKGREGKGKGLPSHSYHVRIVKGTIMPSCIRPGIGRCATLPIPAAIWHHHVAGSLCIAKKQPRAADQGIHFQGEPERRQVCHFAVISNLVCENFMHD